MKDSDHESVTVHLPELELQFFPNEEILDRIYDLPLTLMEKVGMKILMVEDDHTSHLFFKEKLKPFGPAQRAMNGKKAWRLLAEPGNIRERMNSIRYFREQE